MQWTKRGEGRSPDSKEQQIVHISNLSTISQLTSQDIAAFWKLLQHRSTVCAGLCVVHCTSDVLLPLHLASSGNHGNQ